MNKKELYEKNLKGLEEFMKLCLEDRLKYLMSIGILSSVTTKGELKYKLSKEYGGK